MVSVAAAVGQGAAVPAAMSQSALWDGFFREHYAGNRTAERVWRGAGINTRHGVVNPCDEDVSGWGTGARMTRYAAEALPLGKEAVCAALADADMDADEVGLLAVVSCTGYATPGLDISLGRDLGMRPDLQRLMVGHMGCYAALPALGAAADFVVARSRPAVLVCLELTSLHVQAASESARGPEPTVDDLEQMVAHALFSDAAAALVLRPDAPGLEVVDVVAHTDASTSDHMTWNVTDLGFRMGLSARVPGVLARHVRPVVEGLLARHGLAVGDVAGWAVHPGGRRILEVFGERLGLADDELAASYDVLRDHGNASSATVLLVLDQLRRSATLSPGDPVVAMAFGPGLTLYAALLRQSG
ncbi:MAG: type III polyketide synthase [Mycobacteriales bacterium]